MLGIKDFAQTISHQPLGLASYRPESWARTTHCFENVFEKVRRDGGRAQFGWIFHPRLSPGNGQYLIASHHAAWHAPTEHLVDVTPMHEDERHRPATQNGDTIFLVDDSAQPVKTSVLMAPLPSKFFALEETRQLQSYVAHLQLEEEQACLAIYRRTSI
jgi:hypothetical protein